MEYNAVSSNSRHSSYTSAAGQFPFKGRQRPPDHSAKSAGNPPPRDTPTGPAGLRLPAPAWPGPWGRPGLLDRHATAPQRRGTTE